VRIRDQKGFSLVAAIFLLVVVAGLVGFMLNLSTVQHATVAMSLRGAQALQAARTGLDYAAYRVLNAGGCGALATLDQADWDASALDAFQVSFDCQSGVHNEGADSITVYQITATVRTVSANYSSGIYSNPDFVQRTVRATISPPPP
jgi:MSHA biogenesis protein MshP